MFACRCLNNVIPFYNSILRSKKEPFFLFLSLCSSSFINLSVCLLNPSFFKHWKNICKFLPTKRRRIDIHNSNLLHSYDTSTFFLDYAGQINQGETEEIMRFPQKILFLMNNIILWISWNKRQAKSDDDNSMFCHVVLSFIFFSLHLKVSVFFHVIDMIFIVPHSISSIKCFLILPLI